MTPTRSGPTMSSVALSAKGLAQSVARDVTLESHCFCLASVTHCRISVYALRGFGASESLFIILLRVQNIRDESVQHAEMSRARL